MRLRRDSLLIKIIFYNDIAIILTSLMIAGILTFITFRDMDAETKRTTSEKVKTLEGFYDFYISTLEEDIYQMANSGYLSKGNTSVDEINYTFLSTRIKSQMDKLNYKTYKNAIVSLIGYNDEVLGESGREGQLQKLSIKMDSKYLNFLKSKKYQVRSTYVEGLDGETVIRISVPNYIHKSVKGIVISLNIEDDFLKKARSIVGFEKKHKIFYVQGKNYYGDKAGESKLIGNEINYREYTTLGDYYFKGLKVGNESYYIGLYPVRDNKGEIIGNLGIAVSKTDVTQMKALVLLMIASLTIGLILFNSAIFGKIFYKMLNPLVEIAEASNRIARGEKDINLKVQGVGEIRSMVKSFKKMVEKIDENEKALRDKNLTLEGNIVRIEVIEKLLLRIYGEEDMFSVIKTILRAMVSEVGLGYSRGVFLRYSREIESLVGEYAMVNKKVMREANSLDGAVGSFRFQRESLDEIISYIKISVREQSLLAESLLEKKIIYYNDKCYKYNLGNELLQSLGFTNFLIIPIYSDDRDYGCLIIDNFVRNRVVTEEEVELLNLLVLNLSTHFKNKRLEEEKLENERALTIGKLSEKFLDGREDVVNKIYDLLIEAKSGAKDIHTKLIAMENELLTLKREDSILSEYSDLKEYEMEQVYIDELLNEIYLENKEKVSEKGISISLFMKYNGLVLGDRLELKKAFLEVLDNAIDAVMANGKSNKKINILVSKGRKTRKIRIRIIDNGIGMNEAELKTIGEPFISYKKESAGLGLSIAFRIIKYHRGIMKFASTPNDGTEVKITLNDYKEENK